MKNRLRPMLGGGAIALVLAIPMAYAADNITLTETGSTLLYPLFQSWIAGYKSVAANVDLSAAATGSGAGEKAALAGTASIGASDAYLSDAIAAHNPDLLDIPLAISAQTINCNLPGLNGANIKIDGATLAAIYSGAVTQWDDPAIKAMNPGVALPHRTIIPVAAPRAPATPSSSHSFWIFPPTNGKTIQATAAPSRGPICRGKDHDRQ